MTHQLFDDMIGTPPPSTVDVEAIVRRKTGQRRLRRVAVTGVAVLAVAAAFTPLLLQPRGEGATRVGGPSVAPSGAAVSVGPSGGPQVPPDLDHFIDDAMRTWLPQGAQWTGAPPHIVVPPDGGAVTITRAGILAGGRKGTVVVTVWPRGQHDTSGCGDLEHCTEQSGTEPDDCARYEDQVKEVCLGLVRTQPLCGRADAAVRPELGLTHPGWEVRCTLRGGGRAVSIYVTNQTGASGDPLPQPELPVQPEQVIPIITALVTQVQ